MTASWIWFIFIFAFGCCIGSFLNVVIYRLPRDKSLVSPPSACPVCKRHIRFYDNVPLISWLLLGRKCRYCKIPISSRYFVIELLTGVVFLGLFVLYFYTDLIPGMVPFLEGGWLIYMLHIILLGAFIAASAIDLELWIIPLSICWFVTGAGLMGSALGGSMIGSDLIAASMLLPRASAGTGALAIGATIGLLISIFLLASGRIRRSYESESSGKNDYIQPDKHDGPDDAAQQENLPNHQFNHRLEALREVLFLLPIIIGSVCVYLLFNKIGPVRGWWIIFSQRPFVIGFLGSLWGYFIGCSVVWGVRIFGTLAFGKEAMGLGDMHLMGAAGAVIGPFYVVVAFFIAPFFGLAWAGFQMFFKKIHQIPYGPFLSLGVFVVMILHDWILDRMGLIFYK